MPIRLPSRCATAIAFAVILLFAAGCGQKGDLYLPGDAAASYGR